MRCEWFTRLWVVQEVLLAQGAHFMSGSCRISVMLVALHIQGYNFVYPQDAMWIGDLQSQNRDLDFFEVLSRTRNVGCSNPRGRMYGVLDLQFSYSEDREIAKAIEPSYDAPVDELFHHVARCHVRQGLFSRLCGSIHHGDDWDPLTAKAPSWVPGWATPARPLLYRGRYVQRHNMLPTTLTILSGETLRRIACARLSCLCCELHRPETHHRDSSSTQPGSFFERKRAECRPCQVLVAEP